MRHLPLTLRASAANTNKGAQTDSYQCLAGQIIVYRGTNRLADLGKRLFAPRKETVERSFADAKELHGHRYVRFRGLAKVQAQCLLSAACQNTKKMAFKTTEWPKLRFEFSFH